MKLEYPYEITAKTPQAIHKLDEDLIRESPRDDWKVGDICFVYFRARGSQLPEIRMGTITWISTDKKTVEVIPLEPDCISDRFVADTNELFDDLTQITIAIFGPDPNVP